jgi:acetoin utilization protein AcuC
MAIHSVSVYVGEALSMYGFGDNHPLGLDRLAAFWQYACEQEIDRQVSVCEPVKANREIIERFHTQEYVLRVIEQSKTGCGYLDYGDTPAYIGVYEAAATVVGTTVQALARIMGGGCKRAFVPIAGLHHARRDRAGGFCVFNDCGVAIETLRREYHCKRIAYVDIDAHHADGVFYTFEEDSDLIFADIHEDGRFLYPGTGVVSEIGRGAATGTKLNIPMLPYAGDEQFMEAWKQVEAHLETYPPSFILFQCGADSIAGDPITHLSYTPAAHAHATLRLSALANRYCAGHLLVMGGGGYNRSNLARTWTAVVQAMIAAE